MRAAVDGYTIGEVIGIGGFSTVYHARQQQFERDVALKLLTIRLDDPRAVRRFHNECVALGRLDAHPHIADIYAAGISGAGQPFIAMRWYKSGSVAELLAAKGQLPLEQVLEIGCQMADALSAAHSIGIIHRDVKPQNILISERGEFTLSDFGVSALGNESATTDTHAVTYNHAAPETIQLNQYGRSADQYALASTLYTLATGRVPFPIPDQASQVHAIVNLQPDFDDPRLTDLAPTLRRALEKDPAKRYASMADFAEALGQPLTKAADIASRRACYDDPTSMRDPRVGEYAGDSAGFRLSHLTNRISERLTQPIVAAGTLVMATLVCGLMRWLVYVAKGAPVPADAEWLSFRSGLLLFAAIAAGALITFRGPTRLLGYGAALYIVASRVKIISSALLGSVMNNELMVAAFWLLLLIVLTACLAAIALSAWRNRTNAPRTRSGAISLTIMIGTAVASAAYSFWAWTGTVHNVADLAMLSTMIAFTTAIAIFAMTLAYRSDARFGLIGYIGVFLFLHILFVLGIGMNLSTRHDLWYEVLLLVALLFAGAFALHGDYQARRRGGREQLQGDVVIDLRSGRTVKA